MKNIVSIQSTVLNDKVGNHAARSILSDKGYNIYEIPTVILTSHKAVKGTLQINNSSLNPWVIFNKVRRTYKLSLNDLTIIGYTPNSKISKSIGKIINLQNKIVLDPVMGDIGIGLYVEKDVANFFKKVITKVKYISANFFEWSYLNNKDVKKLVLHQTKLAVKAKLDAIVCSPQEVKIVKKVFKKEIITPGIRLLGDLIGDQKRIMTPKEAFQNGATSLVIGRSLTKGNIKKNIQKLIRELK